MKTKYLLFILLLFGIIFSCEKSTPPICTIEVLSNTTIYINETVDLKIEASCEKCDISQIHVFLNDVFLESYNLQETTINISWDNFVPGKNTISANASTEAGVYSNVESVSIIYDDSDPQSVTLAVVTTNTPSEISENSALLGGEVTNDGSGAISERGVCIGSSANPSTSDDKFQIGSGIGSFSSAIGELTAGTTYHVRAYAINEVGIAYGSDKEFTTLQNTSLAVVSTNAAVDVTETSAILGGEVSSDGGEPVSERGICWSSSSNPSISDNKLIIGSGTGTYSASVDVLSSSTTYYVRAYAINANGIAYGQEISFTTSNEGFVEIFYEDFNDNSMGWPTGTTTSTNGVSINKTVSGGYYTLTYNEANWYSTVTGSFEGYDPLEDFEIEYRVRCTSDNFGFAGIAYYVESNFFEYMWVDGKYYTIGNLDGAVWNDYVAWEVSDYFNSMSEFNIIKYVKINNTLSYYINGSQVYQRSTAGRGNLGDLLIHFSDGVFDFDYIKIRTKSGIKKSHSISHFETKPVESYFNR